MERYLLFDSGCSLCSNLAQSVQAESNGLLMARSLREPAIQAILNEVKPGWQWEPMLLEMDDDGSQQVFSGLQMRLRIVSKLGLSHAWRIAKLVGRTQMSVSTGHTGRRSFLRYAGGVVTGAAMAGLHFSMGKAQTAPGVSPGTSGSRLFLPFLSAIWSPSVAEAQEALELVLASPMFLAFRTELEALGLSLNVSSGQLDVVRHESGEFYGAEGQSVVFVGQKEDHRVYQVFLGTYGSTTENEETWLTAFVDTQQQKVLDILQLHVTPSAEVTASGVRDESHRVVVHTSSGHHAVAVVSNDSIQIEEDSGVHAAQSCPFTGAVLCTLVTTLACAMSCGTACSVSFGIGCVCVPVCRVVMWTICAHCP